MILDLPLADEAATARLGAALAETLPGDPSGLLVSLAGDLGSGKTTLVRGLLRALDYDGPVPSPTYTLVEPYGFSKFTLYHTDLYRIADASELEFLGWSDLREGLVFVEWPDRAADLTADADIAIELTYAGAGRRAALVAATARGRRWLEDLALRDPSTTTSK